MKYALFNITDKTAYDQAVRLLKELDSVMAAGANTWHDAQAWPTEVMPYFPLAD